MKLIIEDERGRRTPVPLVHPELRIGRGPENDIRLQEHNVSRDHCVISVVGERVFFRDTSRYGSKFNDRTFTGRVEMSPKDIVLVGSYKLSIEGLPAVSAAPGPPKLIPQAIVTFGHPRLMARSIGLEGRGWILKDGLTIGSSDQCDIVIDRPDIASVHLLIESAGGAWQATQQSDEHPCLVNGEEFDSIGLFDDDLICIGDAELLFLGEDEIHIGFLSMSEDAIATNDDEAEKSDSAAAVA